MSPPEWCHPPPPLVTQLIKHFFLLVHLSTTCLTWDWKVAVNSWFPLTCVQPDATKFMHEMHHNSWTNGNSCQTWWHCHPQEVPHTVSLHLVKVPRSSNEHIVVHLCVTSRLITQNGRATDLKFCSLQHAQHAVWFQVQYGQVMRLYNT